MITKDKIDTYIEKIPPAPKVLKETLSLLNDGELIKASKVAESDLALKSYLKHIVNKPIYGFKNEVTDISQIFTILGVARSQQTVYNYMLSLLSPKEWTIFNLTEQSFHELQARLSANYNKILKHLNIIDKDIQSCISLLPASIIIVEALFKEQKENIELIKSTKSIDYNTILKRLTGMDLFDICEEIAKKWEMSDKISQIIQTSSGIKPSEDKDINHIAKWIHLLLFYELSQPIFIEANLNDFLEFQVEFVEDIYEEFLQVIKVQDK